MPSGMTVMARFVRLGLRATVIARTSPRLPPTEDKAFPFALLLARMRAALRHKMQSQGETPVFHSGDLTVDLVRRLVTVSGREVKFSPREYDVLRMLVTHAGKVVTHKMLLKEIWGSESDIQYLRIYIRALRQKIEADPERPHYIQTEQGVGYRLRSQD